MSDNEKSTIEKMMQEARRIRAGYKFLRPIMDKLDQGEALNHDEAAQLIAYLCKNPIVESMWLVND